ncbi:protein phosphatase CheZ [Oxalicibacterium flavum]|nr:protein phosphatase CheZ [Oxalicibacterium flavum]
MSGDTDEFEALFDEISAQRLQPSSPPAAPSAAVNEVRAETSAAPAVEEAEAAAEQSAADKPMYERLGGIVRLLHDSLRELGYDRSLSDVASEISDAQGRLEYVATLTEQAANKVLNTIDVGMPEQEALSRDAKLMDERWTQLFEGKLGVDEFKALAGDSHSFSARVAAASEAEKARLLDIMMAQDFQDITGQLIKKIVSITHKVESELAQLLRDNAPPEVKAAQAQAEQQKKEAPVELMNGPAAPAVAMAQDDVDSLLADLGF